MRLPSYRCSEYPKLRESKLAFVLQMIGSYLAAGQLYNLCTVSKLCQALFQPILWRDPLGLICRQGDSPTVQSQLITSNTRLSSLAQSQELWKNLYKPSTLVRVLRMNHEGLLDFGTCRVRVPTEALRYLDNLKVLMFEPNQLGLSKARILTPPVPQDQFSQETCRFRETPELYVLSASYAKVTLDVLGVILNQCCRTLLYLDLSYNVHSRALIELLRQFYPHRICANLAILKLAGSFKHDRVPTLDWRKFGKQLFSLDISDNLLKDDALAQLSTVIARPLAKQTTTVSDLASSYIVSAPQYSVYDEWGLDGERLGAVGADRFTDDHEQEHVAYREDSLGGMLRFLNLNGYLDNFSGFSATELLEYSALNVRSWDHSALKSVMSTRSGLTHLHLGGNKFSEKALISCLSKRGLQHLDLGSGQYTSKYVNQGCWQVRTCGFELATEISAKNFERLEYLRIHHSFVTFVGRAATYSCQETTRESIYIQETHTQASPHSSRTFDIHSLPSLRVLDLVDFPRKTYGIIVERIQNILEQAAEQEKLLEELRKRSGSGLRRGPQLWSGLRVLRLEMEKQYANLVADDSVTEDQDAEVFYKEMATDFSFFSDGKGDNGVNCNEGTALPLLDVLARLRQIRASLVPIWHGKVEVVNAKTKGV